ncbi:MAG: hypothetical protein D6730_07860 [Bacteroidetes bacterium]|nr:MAG: hypothetical protein D6730_07860 [Bacteroidota bacterium]
MEQRVRKKLGMAADSRELHLLYLNHSHYGFEEQYVEEAFKQCHPQPEQQTPLRKVFSFGGGMGAVYDLKLGLLDSALGEYSLPKKVKFTAFFENEQEQFEAVKKERFDYVWDEYWYSTRARLVHMREKVFESMIPYYLPEHKKVIFAMVKNFLHYLRAEENSPADPEIEAVPEACNFKTCKDLRHPKFGFQLESGQENEFLNILEEYANERLDSTKKSVLAKELNKMVERIYQT